MIVRAIWFVMGKSSHLITIAGLELVYLEGTGLCHIPSTFVGAR